MWPAHDLNIMYPSLAPWFGVGLGCLRRLGAALFCMCGHCMTWRSALASGAFYCRAHAFSTLHLSLAPWIGDGLGFLRRLGVVLLCMSFWPLHDMVICSGVGRVSPCATLPASTLGSSGHT